MLNYIISIQVYVQCIMYIYNQNDYTNCVRLFKLIIEKLIQHYPNERIIDGTPCSTYLFPFLHSMYIHAYTYMYIYIDPFLQNLVDYLFHG